MKKNTRYLLLVLLLLITVYSRFLNLNWGGGYGFHPDENNLWGASRRVESNVRRDGLSSGSLDPQFYAYGGFPIYLYSLVPDKVFARGVSAGAQVVIVVLFFIIGRRLAAAGGGSGGWAGGLITAAMGAFSAGLIQAAHFLTVESLLGLFGLIITFSLLKFVNKASGRKKNGWLLLAAAALGLGIGTKISFAVFGLPFLAIFLKRSNLGRSNLGRLDLLGLRMKSLLTSFFILAFTLLVALAVFLVTNPFIFDRLEDVRGTLNFEAKAATGEIRVFYTRQFTETIPGWFQTTRVFPFTTGWLFVPLLLVGFGVLVKGLFRKDYPWAKPRIILLIAALSALLSFLPLWAKWTRYVVQVLPVLILVAGIGGGWLWEKGRIGRLLVGLALISFVFPFFAQLAIYATPDSRIQAAEWAETNISQEAKIFTEAMDLGILPFNAAHMTQITLFNFYELDEDRIGKKQEELDGLIRESDYFISVSRRIYGNSLIYPARFPRSAAFYQSFFDGSLGYQKIAEFAPRPAIFSYKLNPEETFSVFDHPTVMIFEHKIKHQNNARPADQLLFRP